MRSALVVLMLIISGSATAEVITIPVSMDNTLYEDAGGGLSNGSGQHFFAGTTLSGQRRRAVIQVDLSLLPHDAIVLHATLKLHMSRTISGAEVMSLHRLSAAWGEGASDAPFEEGGGTEAQDGDVTWLHRFFPGAFWVNPGGDFAPLPSASTAVAEIGFYTWSSPVLTADVQSWVQDPATNFGWLMLGNEGSSGTAKRFDSRENPVPEYRPMLIVEYVPGPGTSALFGVGALAALHRRHRSSTRIASL
jgi:hypothetical protein